MRIYSKTTRIAMRRWLRWLAWDRGTEHADERVSLALWLVTLALLCGTCVAQPVQAGSQPRPTPPPRAGGSGITPPIFGRVKVCGLVHGRYVCWYVNRTGGRR